MTVLYYIFFILYFIADNKYKVGETKMTKYGYIIASRNGPLNKASHSCNFSFENRKP